MWLGVPSRHLVDRVDDDRSGSEVQILQIYSYGVRPLSVFKRRA